MRIASTPDARREEASVAPRAHFVDLLRIVMSVQMIQGHTIDALLETGQRSGPFFDAWMWLRGLTAVGFLVAAGISFHLSSLARWDAYRASADGRRRRIRRAVMLIVIGYVLHAPAGVLTGDPELARAALEEAMIVDVLQCIGVTMLLLEGLAALARRASEVVVGSGVVALLAIALAPITATIDCAGLVRPICNYVSRTGGSLFPLLPWSGFVLAGVVAGAIALPDGARTPALRSAARLAVASALCIAASFAVKGLLDAPIDPAAHFASPGSALLRLGCVIALAAGLAVASARVERLPTPIRTLAGETLFLYVSHLLALYIVPIGLSRVIGPTLPAALAISVALAMIAACAAGALGWAGVIQRRRARRSTPVTTR